jgi:hypothetical protein
MQWFGVRRALPHCLLFGALIPNRPDRRDGILAESGSSPARRSRYCGASLYSGVIRLGGINLEQPGGSSGDTGGIDVFAAGDSLLDWNSAMARIICSAASIIIRTSQRE